MIKEPELRETIRTAQYFTAFIRHSPTDKVRVQCMTLIEAFEQADKLDKTNHYGRRALVYAVTPEGYSIPIPRTQHPQSPRPPFSGRPLRK